MDVKGLLELLDLEEPSEFEYFENFADLVESDEDIPEDILYKFFEEVPGDGVEEIIKNYFDDLLESMPDESMDVFMLLENIKKCLMGLIHGSDDENSLIHFASELEKFHSWYALDSKVICTSLEGGEEKVLPVRDALVLSRLEKLDGEEFSYNFDEALDYELDDYIIDIVDLAQNEYEDEPDVEDAYDDIDDPIV